MKTPDTIDRLNAALEGRYEVEREIGEGGMATVYLAKDLKHNRNVALKVLKPELAAVVGAERFLAEIETTANLQHPHILPLFDSGEADSFLFYVMPYVEGETLRDKLDREHQLPVDDAVRIATNVAEALDYAHRQGVIHRDIKPANILLQDGKPVISDFGIALAVSAGGGNRLTETGLSLGTPHYMSPEQATGDLSVGAATDVYALGCVLYEMLLGEPPYTGSTAQAILGKIISGSVASAVEERASVPRNVDAAIRRALEKLPADRFVGAHDFAKALADSGFRHGESARDVLAAGSGPWKAATMTTAGLAVLLAGSLGWALSRQQDRPVVSFRPSFSEGQRLSAGSGINLAMSPDGSRLVYVGPSPTSPSQLWQRPLDQLEPEPILGTDGAKNPVVSPDGTALAFTANGSLMTISLLGGRASKLVSEGVPSAPGGIDWGSDGMIYFVDDQGSIQRVRASGGEPEPVAAPEAGTSFAWVDALPDGRGVLLTIMQGTSSLSEIAAVDGEGGEVRRLFPGTTGRYATSGHIIYATANNSLLASPFDLDRMAASGQSVALREGVDVYGGSASQFALSQNGTLVYMAAVTDSRSSPVWVDRSGAAHEVDPEFTITGPAQRVGVAISPDGARLAYSTEDAGASSVWVKELDDGPETKLTLDGTTNFRPRWPDGSTVAFVSNRGDQQRGVWERRADGSGSPQPLVQVDEVVGEAVFSNDRAWVVYRVGLGSGDIYAKRLGTDSAAIPLLVGTNFGKRNPALSPDGRWLAYVSSESRRPEVYVVPFPDVGLTRVTVSTDGGDAPVWAHSGDELFYRTANNELWAAQVRGDSSFTVEGRELLFATDGFLGTGPDQTYDVSPDDEQFLMLRVVSTGVFEMTVVQNFFEELKRLVPN